MIVNQRSLSIKDSLCLTFDYAAQYIVWQGEIVLYFPPPAFLFRLTRQTYLKFDLPVIRPMAPLLLRPASPAAWAPKLWPMTWTLEGEYPSDDCGKIKATSLITLKGVSWTYLLDPKQCRQWGNEAMYLMGPAWKENCGTLPSIVATGICLQTHWQTHSIH